MNEEQPAACVLDLGTEFTIRPYHLLNYETYYTIEQVLAALPVTKTLIGLTVEFCVHDPWVPVFLPSPENSRRFIEPLCRCISNLRRHNEHHPLCRLVLAGLDFDAYPVLVVLEQFLVAAKQCGIRDVQCLDMDSFPVQCLVEFCRDNNNIQKLSMRGVSIAHGGAAMSVPPTDDPLIHPSQTLDQLNLESINLENPLAATNFSIFLSSVKNVSVLNLGLLHADPGCHDDDDDEVQLTERIVSEFKMPSVKKLELYSRCQIEHFKAALQAGTTSIVGLVINFDPTQDDTAERMELLVSMIRCAVKLNSLRLAGFSRSQIGPPSELLHAIEACATVSTIQMDFSDPSQDLVQQLQRYTDRNRELACFVANPSIYPTDKLLNLMPQLDNCPSGQYILARHLPQMFSFQKGDSDGTETKKEED